MLSSILNNNYHIGLIAIPATALCVAYVQTYDRLIVTCARAALSCGIIAHRKIEISTSFISNQYVAIVPLPWFLFFASAVAHVTMVDFFK
jgi:hypothetical protein